jgi:hypothetical protein
MRFNVFINTEKLPPEGRGPAIAEILRKLADSVEPGGHFEPENHINGVWGAAPLEYGNKQVGVLEIV